VSPRSCARARAPAPRARQRALGARRRASGAWLRRLTHGFVRCPRLCALCSQRCAPRGGTVAQGEHKPCGWRRSPAPRQESDTPPPSPPPARRTAVCHAQRPTPLGPAPARPPPPPQAAPRPRSTPAARVSRCAPTPPRTAAPPARRGSRHPERLLGSAAGSSAARRGAARTDLFGVDGEREAGRLRAPLVQRPRRIAALPLRQRQRPTRAQGCRLARLHRRARRRDAPRRLVRRAARGRERVPDVCQPPQRSRQP